ncbi:MAG: hypothetical protein JWO59_106, partial [Chloroflexi bacterium]|nr:hypothetical protein [Chloroflexota bacterium]
MLDKTAYCDAFHRDAAGIAYAARMGLLAPVPSCPGWSVAALLTHLAVNVYAPTIRVFRALPNEAPISLFVD